MPVPSIAPHGSAEIPLAFKVPDKGRCFLTVSYVLKEAAFGLPAGHELGFDEIRIPTKEPRAIKAASLLKIHPAEICKEHTFEVKKDGHFFIFEGKCTPHNTSPSDPCQSGEEDIESRAGIRPAEKTFTYKFDTLSGRFTSIRLGERELLDHPMDFNLWRAPTDNDAPLADLWKWERLDHTVTRAYEVSGAEQPETGAYTLTVRQSVAAMSVQPILQMHNKVTVFPDGRILLDVQASKDPEIETLPRIGIRLFLNGNMKQVSYCGMGPGETYIDKHHSGHHSCFKGTVLAFHEDYIRPQENGSHFDCDYVTIRGKGLSLTAACADADPDSTFSFNVSPYTAQELETKRHNYELEPCGSTVLCIDHKLAGIGSKSCGPDLLPKYRVNEDNYHFAIMLSPEES